MAVSATNQCGYCIASHTAAARKAGMTDSMFAELMAVVGMANETNRLASGYQVEIDEQFKVGRGQVPGVRCQVSGVSYQENSTARCETRDLQSRN